MGVAGVVVRNVLNRPLRSGLTLLGVVVAVGSFVALVGASRGVQGAWTRSFVERNTHLVGLRKQAVDLLSATVEADLAGEIGEVPGVNDVAGELIDLVNVEPGTSLLASGQDPASYLWTSAALVSGRMPEPDEQTGLVLGEAVTAAIGKAIGDTLEIEGTEFVVTGIARYRGSLNNSMVVMPLAALQALMGLPGKVTSFSIRARDPADEVEMAALKGRLNEAFPALAFSETREVADGVQAMRFLTSLAWVVSIIALFMGTVAVLNTLLMSVSERTYDIGVLSAIGWTPRRILLVILAEGVALTVVGGALGIAAGAASLRVMAGMPPVLGFLEPAVGGRLVAEVSMATLAMGTAGSLYPAWRAVSLDPVVALRRE